MANYSIINRLDANGADDRNILAEGLLAADAAISPRYFYDELGALLYAAICRLPEYYLTRAESAIFARNHEAIVGVAGNGKQLVDLGAGDCRKAAKWFPLLKPSRYFAVDTAEAVLQQALARLAGEIHGIWLAGLVLDIGDGLDLSAELDGQPVTFFYPGSSIGNFAPESAHQLLRRIRANCEGSHSGLLIGVDTKKNPARLNAAYDDALGVTASFNLNVLNHVNRLLDADFDVSRFRHVAFYNEAQGRVEMHLEARTACAVRIDGHVRHFTEGERIHTENSYKYHPAEFELLLREAGFGAVRNWRDEAGDFCVFYAAP